MREQPLGEIRFATLARAAEGLTQWRPLLLCFLTLLLTGALIAGAAWMLVKAGFFMYLIFMLAAVVALLAGSSGVGIMLMDKARNEPVRSFSAAASAGLLCLPKFLLVGLAIFVATLAYYLLAAVIYFICKIPVLGGILAFVAHPILVLVAAALLIAMIWVVGPLMGPALWSGLSVKAALANVLSIARKRLVEVVLMEVVLYVILGLVCFMLFAGLVPATVSLTGMAMSITGDAGSMAGMFMGGGYGRGYGGGFNPMGMMGGGSTGLIAGLGVLYCVVGALLAQVAIMGMNLIYLQARESVDPAEAEGALDSLIGDVRKKAEEAKAQTMAAAERTMAAAERAKQAASERLQEATAKPAATDTPPGNDSNASAGAATAGAAATGAAAAAAGLTAATAASTEQAFAEQQARERAAADAAEKARQSAEEAAARQRSEAEAARLRAEAEAARLKAEAEAAEQAARERATRERAAAEAEELAARQRAEAQAAERAAQQKAAEEHAAAQAAEEARQQAEAERLKAQAEQLARQQAAEREASRARAEAEAAEKARQAQAAPSCPACSAPVAANDLFCGECGNKLK
ncbi:MULTISPECIES: zinc ribbon domain-containing protein [Comamonas]|uniref:zinc ribbon domain-containing protein n=1 Tax=Comamonas thiooxydans TaxID=363952 RepID=UPI002113C474|nr:zinc ribbon domain-containing protein [Comamonas thiooxydans]UUE94822.1 zinc ribbon domain-containing protein [Comamonas thiooxydans]